MSRRNRHDVWFIININNSGLLNGMKEWPPDLRKNERPEKFSLSNGYLTSSALSDDSGGYTIYSFPSLY